MHLSSLYASYIPCKLHWFSSCYSNDIWWGIQFMKPNVMQTFSGIFLFYSPLVRIPSASDSTSSICIFRLILERIFHTKRGRTTIFCNSFSRVTKQEKSSQKLLDWIAVSIPRIYSILNIFPTKNFWFLTYNNVLSNILRLLKIIKIIDTFSRRYVR